MLNVTSSSNGNLDKSELRIMDKIEDWDKRNQLGFEIFSVSITSSILLKINGVKSYCKEAYDFLTTQYGGTLIVAEVAYLPYP